MKANGFGQVSRATHDDPGSAGYVLDRIEKVIESLATFPERGAYPREFHSIGIRECRETRFKPYRVLYRIIGNRVYIYLIADGRRDMQTLLERRLLGA